MAVLKGAGRENAGVAVVSGVAASVVNAGFVLSSILARLTAFVASGAFVPVNNVSGE